MESDTTTQPRILGLTSFLRSNRPRSQVSPTAEVPPPHPGFPSAGPLAHSAHSGAAAPPASSAAGHRRRPAAGLQAALQTANMPSGNPSGNVSFTQMLRRRRSANGNGLPQQQSTASAPQTSPNPAPNTPSNLSTNPHRIRLVPHLENSRSLHFEPITRECREGAPPIRIGRFTDRSGIAANTNSLQGKIAFKSKVVSRGHAEIWCEANGKFYIKDTSSSSGTFLNHMRLSHAGVESRAFQLKDGDILQLGVDYQGGTEEIYRCVKIRVEIGREWQAQPNAFNTNALAQLRQLSNLAPPPAAAGGVGAGKSKTAGASKSKTSVSDCCICLFPVTVCQALFIAPCSHSFHYKCIRGPLLEHHPGFSCPLCRSFHDLEADVEVELPEEAPGEQWEEPPEEVILAPASNANAASMINVNDEDDVPPVTSVPTANPNQTMLDDADLGAESGMENIIIQGVNAGGSGLGLGRGTGAMRSVEDDLPFQTAAEDNGGRHLLPARLRDSGLRNSRRATMHLAEQGQGQGQAQGPPLPLPDVDSDGPMSGALAGVDTDMDLDEPVGMPHRTRAPNARSIYATTANGSGMQAAGSGSGSSPNLPTHVHSEYPPSNSFGAFDVHVQSYGSQPNLHGDHLISGGSNGSSGSGSRRVPVPAHLYAEAAEMGVLAPPADENMSGGEATAEGNATMIGTKRKR